MSMKMFQLGIVFFLQDVDKLFLSPNRPLRFFVTGLTKLGMSMNCHTGSHYLDYYLYMHQLMSLSCLTHETKAA